MLKNRVMYLLILIGFTTLSYLNPTRETFLATYALIILPVLSFCTTFYFKSRLEIKGSLESIYISKHEEGVFHVSVENKRLTYLPLIKINLDTMPHGIDLSINVIKTYAMQNIPNVTSITIKPTYRGVYPIMITEGTIYDFLGIFKFKKKINVKRQLTVKPDIVSLPQVVERLDGLELSVLNQAKLQIDRHDIAYLRHAILGDDIRQIHWSATARVGQTISKEFSRIENQTIHLYIDYFRTEPISCDVLKNEDALVTAATAIVAYLCQLGQPLTLYSNSGYSVGPTSEFDPLYQALTDLTFGETSSLHKTLNIIDLQQPENASIFVCTHLLSSELLETLRTLRVASIQVTVFIVSIFDSNLEDQYREIGVNLISISREEMKIDE